MRKYLFNIGIACCLVFSVFSLQVSAKSQINFNCLSKELQSSLSIDKEFNSLTTGYYKLEKLEGLSLQEKIEFLQTQRLEEVEVMDEVKETEEETTGEDAEKTRIIVEEGSVSTDYKFTSRTSDEFLVSTDNIDSSYIGQSWEVDNRDLLERIVTGEYGNDYTGAVLVAQTIRDSMVRENTHNIAYIIQKYGYSGRTNITPTDNARAAVTYVFDEGKSGVQHRLMCFYASNHTQSSWHEAQNFVVQHQWVRFFDY